MDRLKKIYEIGPEFSLSLTIAAAVVVLESLLPVHLTGASVIALFLGILLNYFWRPVSTVQAGVRFTSKKALKSTVILLGTPLSIQTILHVGWYFLVAVCLTLLTCLGGGYFVGKALGLNWKLPNLTSTGTGIYGGSAIAAIAPAVNVRDRDITYVMSTTSLSDMVMILLFPIMGGVMGLNDMAYGLQPGTAVNDTSSVVAAGYAFSEAAGDLVTMVKLMRTLSIIPAVITSALTEVHLKRREAAVTSLNGDIRANIKFSSLFPWSILGSLVPAFIDSLGFISSSSSLALKEMNKSLMVVSLGVTGLNMSFKEMYQSDAAPMLHGFTISAPAVIVAIGVEYSMGVIQCGMIWISVWKNRIIFSII